MQFIHNRSAPFSKIDIERDLSQMVDTVESLLHSCCLILKTDKFIESTLPQAAVDQTPSINPIVDETKTEVDAKTEESIETARDVMGDMQFKSESSADYLHISEGSRISSSSIALGRFDLSRGLEACCILTGLLLNETIFATICTLTQDFVYKSKRLKSTGVLEIFNKMLVRQADRTDAPIILPNSVRFQTCILIFRISEIIFGQTKETIDRYCLTYMYSCVAKVDFEDNSDNLHLDHIEFGQVTKKIANNKKTKSVQQHSAEKLCNSCSAKAESDNYCLFSVDNSDDQKQFYPNPLTDSVIRVFENPFTHRSNDIFEFIFSYIVPALVDYIVQSDTTDTTFQLGLVRLILKCLRWRNRGLNAASLVHQNNLNSFLMSSQCLLGGTNPISRMSRLGTFEEKDIEADGHMISTIVSWRRDPKEADQRPSNNHHVKRLKGWLVLHDETLRLMTCYYLYMRPQEIESVLYVLNYSVDSSTDLTYIRLIRWITSYIQMKDNVDGKSS